MRGTARSIATLVLLGLFVVTSHAQFGVDNSLAPKEVKDFAWRVTGRVVFPMPSLLADDVMPVLRGQASRVRAGQAELSMLKLSDGTALWSTPVAGDVTAMNITDGAIVAAVGRSVVGLSPEDGSLLWQQPIKGRLDTGWDLAASWRQHQWFGDLHARWEGIGGAFSCSEDTVFVSVSGTVYALDAQEGAVLWSQKVGFRLSSPLCQVAGVVLAATSKELHALAPESGDAVWSLPIADATRLIVVHKSLYCANRQGTCRVDPATGETLWSAAVPADKAQSVHHTGRCVVARRPNDITALDPESGDVAWRTETHPKASLIDNSHAFFVDKADNCVHCLDLDTLQDVWDAAPDPTPQRLVLCGTVAVAMHPLALAAYDAKSGEELWSLRAPPGELFDCSVWARTSKRLYVKTPRRLVGLDARTGECAIGVNGRFMQVAWMMAHRNMLYLHDGSPSRGGVIAALQVEEAKAPGKPAAEAEAPDQA